MFTKICWGVTAAASCFALVFFFNALAGANGAPQEAAGAAIALAMVAIPYIFTRSVEGISSKRPGE